MATEQNNAKFNQSDSASLLLSCLNKKERKFRESFKKYLIIEFCLLILCGIIGFWNNTSLQLLFIGIFLISFYPIYYCAYKKHGTIYLTFTMIFGQPYSIIRAWSDASNSGDSGLWISLCLQCLIAIPFYYLGLKMRVINKKIQNYSFLNSEVYEAAVISIRSAKNLDDLTYKFHEAFREMPGNFSNALHPIYLEMKEQLSQRQES